LIKESNIEFIRKSCFRLIHCSENEAILTVSKSNGGHVKMKLKTKQAKTPMAQVKSLILSLFNTKTSGKKKLMAAGIILYIISPIDFVPDFIPVVGYADDVILPILFLVANKLLSDDTQMNSTQVRKEAEKV